VLRDAGYVIEEPDSEDELGGVVDEKAAYMQAEEVAEKVISQGDDFGDEKISSPDQHHHPRRRTNEERDVEESGGVDGSNHDDVLGQGRMEERSVLGLILDDGIGEERDQNGGDEEFGEFLG
jgi:hypothetical protein